ncbi:NACHT domain-containing protein [Anaerocolumna chitinilytica]|uniref:ATP-binding protein n=1 Tax=Anaerocolumna chitinilytica TaxID=1727145 RepID=A0A7I8DJC4_9FIRM|nr:hypothetical protein [Anaerocolumna chitinilytica]BCJ98460.1 hypothetical protein bsdcttw_15010 [Anaerocolumna chitinilytica]
MMINIDFKSIRAYDGSQQNGFEELVCQLARLDPPQNAKSFIRKEGAGGDAGVECFWICTDGTELAWQAKYFTEALDTSQWSQIDESVQNAIQKHPNIRKYFICVPRDRTDSRRKNKKGEPVVTSLDTWNSYKEKWEKKAIERGNEIEFIYWGKSELVDILQKDDPIYTGKILYWFDAAVVTSEKFRSIAMNAKTCLGERFTPENHVELPVMKMLTCIDRASEWRGEIRNIVSEIYRCRKDIESITKCNVFKTEKEQTLIELIEKYDRFVNDIIEFKDNDALLSRISVYCDQIIVLTNILNDLSDFIYNINVKEPETRNDRADINRQINSINNVLYQYDELFKNEKLQAGKLRRLLITGEAGSGKSHLLCDFVLRRIDNALPTVFLLGEHYHGGDPIRFLAETLDLLNHSNSSVLGALETLGVTYKTNTLIVIDAINEGNYRRDWYSYIHKFILDLQSFEHIAVIFSCRNTYTDFIIPDVVLKNTPKIVHRGFEGFEKRAALKYLSKHDISIPAVPFLAPEFSNPLFLKITCKTLKDSGFKEFPKGLQGYNNLFGFYLDSIQDVVRRDKGVYRTDIVRSAVSEMVNKLYPDRLWGIPVNEAEKIINRYDSGNNGERTLFDILISEGLFSFDIDISRDGIKTEIIRFTYERFSDFAIANAIVANCKNEEEFQKLINEDLTLKAIIDDFQYWGIVKALGIAVPEKFHRELLDFLKFDKNNDWKYEQYLEGTFLDGILLRSKDSISDNSLNYLNKVRPTSFDNMALDTLLSLSTEPGHPWNADFLDKNLFKRLLAERDRLWTTYISTHDYSEGDGEKESPIRTIINWVNHENLGKVEHERLRLVAIVLLWTSSSSKRMLRQSAIKALAKVFSRIPYEISGFLSKYSGLNDSYVVNGLFAAAYGAIVNLPDKISVDEIVRSVIEHQFTENVKNPHLLTRDYARGIIEYAYNKKGYVIENIDEFRPPYKSTWPLENPLPSEIDALDVEHSSIKSSVQGFLNDFGNYIMNEVTDWTATNLSEPRPKTCYEFNVDFAESLPKELNNEYMEILNKRVVEEEARGLKTRTWINSLLGDKEDLLSLFQEGEDKLDDREMDFDNVDDREENSQEKFNEESCFDIFRNKIDEINREYLRWLCHEGVTDRNAKFDLEWAKRWVIKRAYTLGWTSKLFKEFERIYCGDAYRRNGGLIERIGKKYQWIAYYELLEHLSGNLYFNDRGYEDVDDSKFWGPWQINVREMDPTYWFEAKKDICYDDIVNRWWRPYYFNFDSEDLAEQKKWLCDEMSLPDFQKIICTVEPGTDIQWLTLRSFCDWKIKALIDDDKHGEPALWYRINTCIINQRDFNSYRTYLSGRWLGDPNIIYVPNTGNQRFWGEYPWHPSYDNIVDWLAYDNGPECKYHVPLYEYEFSTSRFDHMEDETSSFYMPSKKIIEEMGLTNNKENPGEWMKDNIAVFRDPSLDVNTQPCALFEKKAFCEWLNKNDYVLIWLIGGEKQLFSPHVTKFFGRLNYNYLYCMDGKGNINSDTWIEQEAPRGNR